MEKQGMTQGVSEVVATVQVARQQSIPLPLSLVRTHNMTRAFNGGAPGLLL